MGPDPRKIELEAGLLSVLGQSTRLRLLYMLRDGERCVCEIHPAMPEDQSVISRHLTRLRETGVLESRKEGISVYYRIRDLRVFDLLKIADTILRDRARERAREVEQVL
jgi:ArsR family transcriptional regulator